MDLYHAEGKKANCLRFNSTVSLSLPIPEMLQNWHFAQNKEMCEETKK